MFFLEKIPVKIEELTILSSDCHYCTPGLKVRKRGTGMESYPFVPSHFSFPLPSFPFPPFFTSFPFVSLPWIGAPATDPARSPLWAPQRVRTEPGQRTLSDAFWIENQAQTLHINQMLSLSLVLAYPQDMVFLRKEVAVWFRVYTKKVPDCQYSMPSHTFALQPCSIHTSILCTKWNWMHRSSNNMGKPARPGMHCHLRPSRCRYWHVLAPSTSRPGYRPSSERV